MGRLQAENPLIPGGIMVEADVFDPEFILPSFPLRDPGQMHLIELPAKPMKFGLTKPGNFDLVGAGKNNPEHGDPLLRQINRKSSPS
jgi:hypothetical protein